MRTHGTDGLGPTGKGGAFQTAFEGCLTPSNI